MGTLKKLLNKLFFNSKKADKEIETVKADIKHPKDNRQRAFKPAFTIGKWGGSPEFHPKRTKLKGYQRENARYK